MPAAFEPDFDKGEGILPAVVQDATSGRVLMVAFMNRESFRETVRTGRTVFFSRSRRSLWRKGEQSGRVQWVKSIHVDCDADAILLRVDQVGGAACHEGYESCFFREITSNRVVIRDQRLFEPAEVYGTTSHEPGAGRHDDGAAWD